MNKHECPLLSKLPSVASGSSHHGNSFHLISVLYLGNLVLEMPSLHGW